MCLCLITCLATNLHYVYLMYNCTILALCPRDACPYQGQICQVTGNTASCKCECQGGECFVDGPVCADNGMTFRSYREYDVWRCESRSYDISLAYRGACQGNLPLITQYLASPS